MIVYESYRVMITSIVNGVQSNDQIDYDTWELFLWDYHTNYTSLYPNLLLINIQKMVKTYTNFQIYGLSNSLPVPPNFMHTLVPPVKNSYTKKRVSLGGN